MCQTTLCGSQGVLDRAEVGADAFGQNFPGTAAGVSSDIRGGDGHYEDGTHLD